MEAIVKIPENVNVEVEGLKVKAKGEKGEVERDFYNRGVANVLKFEKQDNKLKININLESKKGKALLNTVKSHVLNLFKGVQEGFEYKLKIVYVHFPISVEVKGNEVQVKNFLGQKDIIKTQVPENVKVETSKDEIKVSGMDKELVGQTAARLERMTKLSKKDRRKFQDGIFIHEKPTN